MFAFSHWRNVICKSRNATSPARLSLCQVDDRNCFRPWLEVVQSRLAPAVVSWDGGGGDFEWSNAANWDNDVLPAPADDVVVNIPGANIINVNSAAAAVINSLDCNQSVHLLSTLTIAGNANIGGFISVTDYFSRFNLGGTMNVAGLTVFQGGKMAGAGTINANGGLNVGAGQPKDWDGLKFNLYGDSVYDSAYVTMNNSATLTVTPGATLDFRNGCTLAAASFNCPFINNGVIRRTVGTGNVTIGYGVNFTNTGSFEISTGSVIPAGGISTGSITVAAGATLKFDSDVFTLAIGSTLSGAGSLRMISGTANLNGNYSLTGPVSCEGGVLNFNSAATIASLSLVNGATISGSSNVIVAGSMTWTGGLISGGGTLFANSGVDISTTTGKSLSVKTLSLGGSSTWTAGNVILTAGGTLLIQSGAVFDVQFGGFMRSLFSSDVAYLKNYGTFIKSTSFDDLIIDSPIVFTNAGTLDNRRKFLVVRGAFASYSANSINEGTYLLSDAIFQFPNAGILTNKVSITLDQYISYLSNANNGVNSIANLSSNTSTGQLYLTRQRALSVSGAFGNDGILRIDSQSSFSTAAGNYTQTSGTTSVDGAIDPFGSFTLQGGVLSGAGIIAAPLNASGNGVISPGSSLGMLTVNGNTSLASGSALSVDLNGLIAGNLYDQLKVTGTVNVTGATLLARMNFGGAVGNSFVVLDNDGSDAVVGTFAGLPQGSTFPVGEAVFSISYTGGTGNDIVLTIVSADSTPPKIVGVFLDGSAWTGSFRTAAGNATYGYAAQTAGNQLTALPWSTIDTIYIQFSEPVGSIPGNLGIRGLNVANYTPSAFSWTTPTVLKVSFSTSFDTDRILLELIGSGGSGIADPSGNKLAGSWTEGVSTFPTSGSAGTNFQYRFLVGVGDADRNGLIRNADVNLVRSQLFIDAGQPGYSIYADIDGNGQTRNADLNAVRSHLFNDPPAGPGPFRPGRGRIVRAGNPSRQNSFGSFDSKSQGNAGRGQAESRRLPHRIDRVVLDDCFESLSFD